MKKIIEVKGMHCEHCSGAVEKALNGIDGVSAKVDLKKNRATVNLYKEVADDVFRAAINEAGFEMGSVTVKRGIFG